MRTIYLDSDYKCHVERGEAMTAAETDFFDGRCQTFIEGYRFIPDGASWTREDGVVFKGEMASPFKPYYELDAAQREHEHALAEAAMILLGEVST